MVAFKAGVKKEVDTVKTLEAVAAKKLAEIESNTITLSALGFPYMGSRFQLSVEARMNAIMVMARAKDRPEAFPIPWSTVENKMVSINNVDDFIAFYDAMLDYTAIIKASAAPLRDAVAAVLAGSGTDEEKIAAIEAIKDPRL